MRITLIVLMHVLMLGGLNAQTYNNEWIDFSKTYYKFPVGANGIYHISRSALNTIGLASTPVEQFQLWRNGKEVPLYTSVASGPLNANGYLEFYGEMNDGKADRQLYKYDSLQMTDKWSLYTDTAMYFLTVNNSTSNKRYTTLGNDVSDNILAAETEFNYSLSRYYRNMMNNGYGVDYGEMIYSSSYETGEGWTSNNVSPGSLTDLNNNLWVNQSSLSSVTLDAQVAGNASALRHIMVKLNGTQIADTLVYGYNIKRFHITGIPLSLLSSGNAQVEIVNGGTGSDKIVVAGYQLNYPRLFNFGGVSDFRFNIPAGAPKYIEISNFNFGSKPPVLLDLNNQNRIVGNLSGSVVRFVLPATAQPSDYVLLNVEDANIHSVSGFQQRIFINHALLQQQGNYMIISNPLLFDDGTGTNQVELYKQYRESAAGGSYQVVINDINELTDQFAFGIKHHPLAIRNFGYYCNSFFNTPPSYYLLIGKGLNYQEYRKHESDPNISKWALVPTFGYPPSDNLLFAERTHSYANANVGRLSAISGIEVKDYLTKVKQFELNQVTGPQTIENKAWMKNVATVTGAIADPSLSSLINFYMSGYSTTIADTFYGAKVYNFNKNSGSYTALGSKKTIDDLFNGGLGYLIYFGHSSPNTLEFNLDNPQNYSNSGKYPLIMVNGCNTGNLFLFDTLRAFNNGSLSEKYVFADQKGGIAFISDTHYGLPQQLDFFTSKFNQNLSSNMYGSTLGAIMRNTGEYLCTHYTNDFATRVHAEEIAFHGDPALRLNPFQRPDYAIRDSMITTDHSPIDVSDEIVNISVNVVNIGKATGDSVMMLIQHQLPDQSVEIVMRKKIAAIKFDTTLVVQFDMDPIRFAGMNKIMVSIDPDNLVSELSESNNTAQLEFEVIKDNIKPVYPFKYSIIGNDAGLICYGSTANPIDEEKTYVMEMDTTRLFNSPLKITRLVTDSGGVIQFIPGITLTDSTTYYWRTTTAPVTADSYWQVSSFTLIRNLGTGGFSQSHFYQHTDSRYNDMQLDSLSRRYQFNNKTRKLLIRTGLYPYYLYDQIDVNIDNDKVELYGCVYNSLQFVVYNPITLTPWKNWNVSGTSGRFGSSRICLHSASVDTTRNFFEFNYPTASAREAAMNFFDSIPDGYLVSITNLGKNSNTTFIDSWKADTAILGSGKSLWHKFHQMGLHQIDSFTSNKPFLFLFKKGDTINFPVRQHVGAAENVHIADTFNLPGRTDSGSITSPGFGPAKQWKRLKWKADQISETSTASIDLYGIDNNENENLLRTIRTAVDTTLNFIDASQYPKLKMVLKTTDPLEAVPEQLKYWMLTADEYPEGALAPNLYYSCRDTLYDIDTLHFRVAFKNVSETGFDSLTVRLTLKSASGDVLVINNLQSGKKLKPLSPGDTAIIHYSVPMAGREGLNRIVVEVNPDNDQPEQFHYNNVLQRDIYVIEQNCLGSGIQYTVAGSSGYNYQWQVDTGNGYTNLSDGGVYSGVHSTTLNINSTTFEMEGYKYRLVSESSNETLYSQEFILKYTSVWLGTISSNWHVAANWSCSMIPDSNTDVIVKSGAPNMPVVSANANCHTLNIYSGASVRVNSGYHVQITGK